jgi:ribosomal protein S18 acetylase RimI-like enzyme
MTISYDTIAGPDFVRFIQNTEEENADVFERIRYLNSSSVYDEFHFIALDDKKVVGNLAIQTSPFNPDEMWLMHVAVDSDYRNKGIAKSLATMLFSHINSLDANDVAAMRLTRSIPSYDGTKYFSGVMDSLIVANPHINVVSPAIY